MLIIEVLGSGCANCHKLEAITRKVAEEEKIDARIELVTDRTKIKSYGILATPGLVVNGKVVSAGRIPNEVEIAGWLKA
jgi:small redox-active disulfide protein 2